ncbi:choline/ethanolamine kinase-like isoform X2 [Condylostylus longicornis]|uniref:choline/ethanolamine kinase-like isoform X2 n=1 Tax=Condylostylus longicornis TaxID=2530218 RepID=UPI00244E047A|nr:choline/ethanolamine kinase-like isoform X2 [Condylostylus longicornis]
MARMSKSLKKLIEHLCSPCATIEEMRDIAARICRDYLTGQWKSITAKDIKLKRISGGLSNFLYHVSLPETSCDNIVLSNNINNNNSIPVMSAEQLVKSAAKRIRKDSGNCNSEPREVLLRIYGQVHGENALETMLTESVVFTLLSERNLGPKLHGIFPGGRIEQYIPARALATSELSNYKISMKVAEKMADIHSLDIPVSKEPDWVWNSMNRWLKTIEAILKDIKEEQLPELKSKIQRIKSINFKEEVLWIKTIIEDGDFPVVFCHNDLQEGNILLKEPTISARIRTTSDSLSNVIEDSGTGSIENLTKTTEFNLNNNINGNLRINNIGNTRKRSLPASDNDSFICDLDNTRDSFSSCDPNDSVAESNNNNEPDLIIIDYEYCAYNYRGFDLANHFLEWTLDYTNDKYPYFYHFKEQYPNEQQQRDFITTYLQKINQNYDLSSITTHSRSSSSQNVDLISVDEPTKEEIDEVLEEVKIFSMVSHLFWCLWSVVNVHQNIEFGYWDYAICRLKEYEKAKKQFSTTHSNKKNKIKH